MPKVEFLADFDWTDPRMPQRTTAFKKGMKLNVTTPCAKAAIAAGKAKPAEKEYATGSSERG